MKKQADIILDKIYILYGNIFESKGYFPNKRKSIYIKTKGLYEFHFEINISGGSNMQSLRQHLTLTVYHKTVSDMIKKCSKQIEGEYVPKGKATFCCLTDWKDLLEREECHLYTIWFGSIDSLSEIDNWKDQFEKLIYVADCWFNQIVDIPSLAKYNNNRSSIRRLQWTLTYIKVLAPDQLVSFYNMLRENLNMQDAKRLSCYYEILKSDDNKQHTA